MERKLILFLCPYFLIESAHHLAISRPCFLHDTISPWAQSFPLEVSSCI